MTWLWHACKCHMLGLNLHDRQYKWYNLEVYKCFTFILYKSYYIVLEIVRNTYSQWAILLYFQYMVLCLAMIQAARHLKAIRLLLFQMDVWIPAFSVEDSRLFFNIIGIWMVIKMTCDIFVSMWVWDCSFYVKYSSFTFVESEILSLELPFSAVDVKPWQKQE